MSATSKQPTPQKTSSSSVNKNPSRLSGTNSEVRKVSASKNSTANPKQSAQKDQHHGPESMDEYTIGCPPGLYRLFISTSAQQALNIRSDEDITQEDNIKLVAKQLLLDDITKKMATSDFYPFRKQIEEYPEEEITVIYDYEFQYDKNFFLCFDLDLKSIILNPPMILPPEPVKEPPKYVPPVSKSWPTLGSEKEIEEQIFCDRRPLLKYQVQVLKESLNRRSNFTDLECDEKRGLITIAPFEDSTFNTKMLEMEKAVQAAEQSIDCGVQTVWRYPKNAIIQYEARSLDDNQKQKLLESQDLADFLKDSLILFESALQQNFIFNSFENDWSLLGSEMATIGGPGEINLKEYQSFSDVHSSKNKVVTCVQWHPTLKGIVAMSLAENYTYYDRIDNLSKAVITPSLILIWSFVDPIQPKLLLEAPDDIFSFAFSPTEPNIIAGGCINGQVALWDISQYEEHLVNPRGDHRDKDLFIAGFEDESYFQIPRIRYCALSSLEYSHNQPITDLMWVPDHFEIDRQGFPTESKASQNYQLITAAIDNQILFWDTRSKTSNIKKKENEITLNGPETFKHLSTWKPLLKVALPCSDPGGDFAPTKFSIAERQGDKSTIELEDKLEVGEKKDDANKGNFTSGGKPGSGKSRLLQHLNTHIAVGTEDGQFVYVDWIPQKDSDSSKLTTSKAEWYSAVSDGPVVAMKRSPFFSDIILMAGGNGFNIWREKVFTGALLKTRTFGKRICDAEWSPTRPGVFFIAKSDGTLDIWDLLDRTHAPILTQSISIHKLTYLNCKIVNSKQQLIGIGDTIGTLHIMEVPWALRRTISGEYNSVKAYFSRETERRSYVKSRWEYRDEEKRELERQAALKVGLGPPHHPTDEEINHKLKSEFNEYLQFEASVLRELGLRAEEDSTDLLITTI